MSADTAITAEKVTAAVKSSATFNAPRISRCGEDASVLRRDAEPPAERAAETRVLAKTLPGALQRCKGLSRAGNVHTCSTGKVLAVSTFQGSEFPRHKKKERSGTGSKTPGEPETLCRKAGGGVLGVLQFPRTGSGHPDSRFHASPRILENWTVSKNRLRPSRIQIPRLAADFGTWTDFKIQISPCRIQITRLALRFGN